ncbi:MAG: enoyl-CoA hydratase/isomerase family protein, partial [Candidatus Methylomirabilales bacterium]
MPYATLALAREDAVAILTFNRPEKLNAINRQVLGELHQALDALAADAGVRAIILTGAGEKAFVAGADIAEFTALTPVAAVQFGGDLGSAIEKIARMPKAVLAAVNGFCLGGGCELAMGCDFIYAAENARFGQPEINLGIIPGSGGTQRLPRLVGKARAKELIFTGDMIDAQEALRIGLVNRVLPLAELLPAAKATAAKMAAKSGVVLGLAKAAIEEGTATDLACGEAIEDKALGMTFSNEDNREGVEAFLEKRKP